jgi:hypothetical protein
MMLVHSLGVSALAGDEIVASLGHPAFYPFVFSDAIVRKFLFMHHIVKFHDGVFAAVSHPP